MKIQLLNILIKPDEFFSGLIREKESFTWPLVIVLAGSIAAAGYGYLVGGATAQMMSEALPGIGAVSTLLLVFGAVVGVFVFWLIWTAVIFALSLVFKGDGTFKRTLQVTGYGYLPQVFGSIISLIVAFEYVPRIVVPRITTAMAQDPVMMQEAVKILLHDPAMVELTQITTLITIVFLLWSANIWIFGIRHARNLSPRDAALCVGIPVVGYVLYMIYTLGVS